MSYQKKLWLLIGIAFFLVVGTNAQANHFPRCTHDSGAPGWTLTCTKQINATTNPYEFEALGSGASGYDSFWIHSDGHSWVAYSDGIWCRDYGLHANVRVKENWCNGPLVVTARTESGSALVWFTWRKW